MTDERRGDDQRIAEIQRMCHDMQIVQKELAVDYKSLAHSQQLLTSRVALVEERHNSQQRETALKLDALHELLVNTNKAFEKHDEQESKDRKAIIGQQRTLIFWLIGVVVTGAGAVVMMLLQKATA
jgi:hypothetical protein